MKVLTMIIWTCSRDGGSSFHVISPPTQLDLLTLSRGYRRIPEDTGTIHAMDGPAFLAFPLLSILTSLHWRGGVGHRIDTRGYQKIPEHTNFLELLENVVSSCSGLPPATHPHLLVEGADSPVPPELPLCCARPGIPVYKHKQRI